MKVRKFSKIQENSRFQNILEIQQILMKIQKTAKFQEKTQFSLKNVEPQQFKKVRNSTLNFFFIENKKKKRMSRKFKLSKKCDYTSKYWMKSGC